MIQIQGLYLLCIHRSSEQTDYMSLKILLFFFLPCLLTKYLAPLKVQAHSRQTSAEAMNERHYHS